MGLDMDNPAIHAGANVIEATTNLPVARFVQKIDNIQGALDVNNQDWQRVALLMGYPKWQLGIEDTEVDEAQERGKAKIKEIKEAKKAEEVAEEQQAEIETNIEAQEEERRDDNKKVQCSHIKTDGDRCKMQTTNKSGKCYYHD